MQLQVLRYVMQQEWQHVTQRHVLQQCPRKKIWSWHQPMTMQQLHIGMTYMSLASL